MSKNIILDAHELEHLRGQFPLSGMASFDDFVADANRRLERSLEGAGATIILENGRVPLFRNSAANIVVPVRLSDGTEGVLKQHTAVARGNASTDNEMVMLRALPYHVSPSVYRSGKDYCVLERVEQPHSYSDVDLMDIWVLHENMRRAINTFSILDEVGFSRIPNVMSHLGFLSATEGTSRSYPTRLAGISQLAIHVSRGDFFGIAHGDFIDKNILLRQGTPVVIDPLPVRAPLIHDLARYASHSNRRDGVAPVVEFFAERIEKRYGSDVARAFPDYVAALVAVSYGRVVGDKMHADWEFLREFPQYSGVLCEPE